ncbi:MAG TPA: GreA/GreB family elongation factor, partial [Thiopseudomonas sp.]|nr:GreA/GreB family elongation factor [Thiopseudomonas sp.]
YISIDAPLARALLGKSLDAEVKLITPEGEREFYITAIDYQ